MKAQYAREPSLHAANIRNLPTIFFFLAPPRIRRTGLWCEASAWREVESEVLSDMPDQDTGDADKAEATSITAKAAIQWLRDMRAARFTFELARDPPRK